jgi:hypothetical protein
MNEDLINLRGYIFKVKDISVVGPLVFDDSGHIPKEFSVYSKGLEFKIKIREDSEEGVMHIMRIYVNLKKRLGILR